MKTILTRTVSTIILASFAIGAFILFLPAQETVDGAPPIPKGYSSELTLKAAYALGTMKLIDIENVPVPNTIAEATDVEFCQVGEKSLLMDIYRHKDAKDAPAILFIHGGSWKGGDRAMMKYYCVRFAEKGYVTATSSYRLSREAPFPAALQDVKSAIRWLKTNAETYGLDPQRLAVSGNSAGGHLAMMAGYFKDASAWEGDCTPGVDSSVRAVVNIYGPTDLTAPMGQNSKAVKDFLAATYEENPEIYAQASPVTHLTKQAPPTLIIHGTLDTTVPIDQADLLAAKLEELGIPHTYEKYQGWPHVMDVAESVNKRVIYTMEMFLREWVGE